MSAPKFTPGPWGLESATRSESGSDLVITDGEGGYTIAVCRSSCGVPDVEVAEANARLIAAAPDFHKASDSAITNIGSAGIALAQLRANGKIRIDEDSKRWLDDVEAALSAAEDALDAALAKAEGQP